MNHSEYDTRTWIEMKNAKAMKIFQRLYIQFSERLMFSIDKRTIRVGVEKVKE
jgi:hypothetical protein